MQIQPRAFPISDDYRIATLLVERGKITQHQLEHAVRAQLHRKQLGFQSALGEICVENGWCTVKDIMSAMKEHEDDISHSSLLLGQILFTLGFISQAELSQALEEQKDCSMSLGDTLIELGYCSEEQIKVATEFQTLYRNGLLRHSTLTRFHPYNIMELLVNDEINNIIAEKEGCFCQECWANIFALAMNGLPPLYVTNERLILAFIERTRAEYADRVRGQLEAAVEKVKQQPKGACRGQRLQRDLERIRLAKGYIGQVTVHVCQRHVHLCTEHKQALFGADYEFAPWKDCAQPGQYITKEVVSLIGKRGKLENVHVYGPLRKDTQVEISETDQYLLGVNAPLREPGNLKGTPGIRLIGPAGEIEIPHGVIRPLHHIHLNHESAGQLGVRHAERVDVRLSGDRMTVSEGVLIWVDESEIAEMHIDSDEAYNAGISAKSIGDILRPSHKG
jgi:putative phosphotransacetylase